MKRDWVIWIGCVLLFSAGVVWGLIQLKHDFFIVSDVHDLFEIIASGATTFAVCVAVVQVNAWRKQLKATTDHDLARKLLISIYRYKEAIKSVRHPLILNSETAPNKNEDPSTDPGFERFLGLCRAYDRRFKVSEEIRILLLSELIEADVIWGPELRDLATKLIKLEVELASFLRSYLVVNNPKEVDDMRHAHEEILRNKRDVIFDDLSEEGDEFAKDFNIRLERCEQFLKTKFIR